MDKTGTYCEFYDPALNLGELSFIPQLPPSCRGGGGLDQGAAGAEGRMEVGRRRGKRRNEERAGSRAVKEDAAGKESPAGVVCR